MTEVIERLKPYKWKILKVLPVISDELAVSDQVFQSFVERHRHLETVLLAENNHDMTESYLMVDPLGRFFQNKPNILTGDSLYVPFETRGYLPLFRFRTKTTPS